MKHEEIISAISCGSLVIGGGRAVDPSEYIHRSDHHFCSVPGQHINEPAGGDVGVFAPSSLGV